MHLLSVFRAKFKFTNAYEYHNINTHKPHIHIPGISSGMTAIFSYAL